VLGWPTEAIVVPSLGFSAATQPGKVARVELLGTGDRVNWRQQAEGLRVELPKQCRPKVDYAAALKVALA
jgi:alpha-L-fucosidase